MQKFSTGLKGTNPIREHKGCSLGMDNKVVRVAHNTEPVVALTIYVFELR